MGLREDLRGKNFLDTPLGQSVLRYRRMFIVVSQVLLVVFAYFLSFVLRYDLKVEPAIGRIFWQTLPWLLLVKLVVFYYYDLYRGWWRYVGMDDLLDIIRAATVSTLVYVVVAKFFFPVFPRSIFVIDWFITITFIGGIRFLLRAVREKLLHHHTGSVPNVLIYGSREIGVELLKEIRSNESLRMNVIGFIDDFAPKKGFKIHGISILGGRDDIPEILERHDVDEIIITSPSVKPRELKDLINRFKETNVRFKIVPPMADIINEKVSIKQLRDVSVEDLLGRKMVHLDTELIREHLAGKVILITGAGGTIGSELCRQVAANDPEAIIMFERSENALFMIDWDIRTHFPQVRTIPIIGDILNRPELDGVMSRYKPTVVFHAAAYKHVPMMEIHPFAAIKNNVEGTVNIALASIDGGVERFVFISTDKAVRPSNVMGMTKRIGELILQDLARRGARTRFIAVRFGNVMGSAGSVIPLFQRQISEGGPITVTHPKARRYFMTVQEAGQLVTQAAAMGKGGEIFVLEMGEQINILELAKNLLRLSGLEPDKDIEIKFIGLRPGEKMSEELFLPHEELEPTPHEKIRVLPARKDAEQRAASELVAELVGLAEAGDLDKALALMKDVTREEERDSPGEARPPVVLHQPRRD
ncbi:MAG: polysaccharide biosynthesis protein [Deltaproteobacteria bacterium]|nr:polysaccharide biosynthesis protein [Deltaproteobacteria bacterium]